MCADSVCERLGVRNGRRQGGAGSGGGDSQTRQSTPDGRDSLQIAKKESMSIALATTSTDSRDRPERQADVVGDKVARGGVCVLSCSTCWCCASGMHSG